MLLLSYHILKVVKRKSALVKKSILSLYIMDIYNHILKIAK